MDAHENPAPAVTPYTRLGGEPGVRVLVDRFYDLMELEPRYAVLRGVHGILTYFALDAAEYLKG